MSMDSCKKCGEFVDTDIDCQFYDFTYKVNGMGGHCENCRDDFHEAMTEQQQAEHEKRVCA